MPDADAIVLDAARCNGDGVCVAVCPAMVYAQGAPGTAPAVARPEGCIRCGHCVAACPTEALNVHGVHVAPFPAGRTQSAVAPADLLHLMQRRRSVRRMTDLPVPEEALKQIILAASAAPTAKNVRAVRITVVQDAALRQALVARCLVVYRGLVRKLGHPLMRGLLRVVARRRAEALGRFLPGFRRLVGRLEAGEDAILFDAPVTLVFSAPAAGMSVYDASYAVMNACLMAESLGLGTCIMGYFMEAARRDAEMRRLMQLPDYERVFGAVTLGYPQYRMQRLIERRRFRTAKPAFETPFRK